MDRDTLRLILIVVGVILIACIFLFWNPEKRKQRHASRKRAAEDQTKPEAEEAGSVDTEVIQQELEELGRMIADDRGTEDISVTEVERPAQIDDPEYLAPDSEPDPQKSSTPARPEPDLVVTLFIRARVNRRISGLQLLEATTKAGLRFGDMNIFHRIPKGGKEAVFSMANLVSPGNFDPEGWNLFETPGVSLFLSLPGPVAGLDAWDSMLATAQRLAELLQADLLDDAQAPVTRQRVAEIRESMREYDRNSSAREHGE